jgi:hypothetical protein
MDAPPQHKTVPKAKPMKKLIITIVTKIFLLRLLALFEGVLLQLLLLAIVVAMIVC